MSDSRRGPKLSIEQQQAMREWLAAEYSAPLIMRWFMANGWPRVTRSAISYYRTKWALDIEAARQERRSKALTSGLALKEERVQRLVEHADELEAIKWVPDEKGRLWNEKAWRETLDDIAKEVGHRRQGVDLDLVDKELDAALDKLQHNLSPEVYAQVLQALADEEGTGEA